MSSTLMWRPIAEGSNLPDALKFALQKRYNLDGPVTLGVVDYDYLHGLADAGVEGATEVLELLHRHGTIELYLAF